MANRFAPSNRKKLRLPSLHIPALPKLMKGKKRRFHKKQFDRVFSVQDMLLLLGATLLFIVGILVNLPTWAGMVVFGLSALIALFPAILTMLRQIFAGKLPDEDALVLAGVIAAFCIGEPTGGAIGAILYRLAQILEAYAQTRGEAAFELLCDKLPEKARLESVDGVIETVPESVSVGDIVCVDQDESFPLDGVILEGVTDVDLSPLTGNATLKSCGIGDPVYSGSINCGKSVRVRVTSAFGDSAAATLLHEVEQSARYETQPERLTSRFAAVYGPVIGVIALLIAVIPPLFSGLWISWLRRAVIFLLLASPSALVVSVPLACLGAEMSGVRKGILSKGHDCFEVLAQVKIMVFGKTGTITEGRYTISEVFPNGVSVDNLLAVAAAAESNSQHPIALALKWAAGWMPEIADGVMEVEEIPGRGVSAFLEGRHVYVGNAALLRDHGIPFAIPSRSGAAIHVAVENRYWGHIMITDKTREGAFDALEELRIQGVDQMVMLTGDVLSVSRPLASSLGFDMMRSELTTEGKVSAVNYLLSGKGAHASLAYVGDGIHDAPMLKRADVGLSLHALSALRDADAADILLLDDEIASLPAAMRIARALRRILWENIGILWGVKLLVLILALCGVLPISIAAVCNTLCSALVLLNALRAFGLE